jgi:diphthamide synthase (EF-2-diphthine--ammonia ligase)
VALVSGGKDSCYSIHQCIQNGHEVRAVLAAAPLRGRRPAISPAQPLQVTVLANLLPEDVERDELDSFMYQTVFYAGAAPCWPRPGCLHGRRSSRPRLPSLPALRRLGTSWWPRTPPAPACPWSGSESGAAPAVRCAAVGSGAPTCSGAQPACEGGGCGTTPHPPCQALLPLAHTQVLAYEMTDDDEVEDLYRLLQYVKVRELASGDAAAHMTTPDSQRKHDSCSPAAAGPSGTCTAAALLARLAAGMTSAPGPRPPPSAGCGTFPLQAAFPDVEAVASGAIASDYQRLRVENVGVPRCATPARLGGGGRACHPPGVQEPAVTLCAGASGSSRRSRWAQCDAWGCGCVAGWACCPLA